MNSPSIRDLASGVRSLAGIVSKRCVFGGPRSITLAISGVCNTNCIMCPCHSALLAPRAVKPGGQAASANSFMDMRVLDNIVRQCRAMGTFRMALCGDGEPTLHPQIDDMLKLVAKLGGEPYVITNGLALDNARLRLWSTLRAHYRFSIHAGDEPTWLRVHPHGRPGQFEELSRVLKILTASGIPRVSALHVIHRANYARVREMLEHARHVGIREVLFRPVQASKALSPVVLTVEEECKLRADLRDCLCVAEKSGIRTNIREYLSNGLWIESGKMDTARLYQRIPCYIGWVYADFDRDGTVRPCVHSQLAMGRIGDRSLKQIWNSPEYWAFRSQARSMPRSGKLVRGCLCSQCCLARYNVNIHGLLHLKSFRYGQA